MHLLNKISKRTLWISALGGMLAGFLNGLFGSGGGTVIVPFLEHFLKQDEHTSHATAILIILGFTMVSLLFYGRQTPLNYSLALQVSGGGVIGGLLGAKLLKKLSGNCIRKIFGSFMILAAIRMVVGS
ncbi:MAG: sulfite exporter TauE/SafE family protein [Ruminococcaceae bacterium]|nr:sulfite exporter TauE/SafE family protein [Oscillospiraceae bacterium]